MNDLREACIQFHLPVDGNYFILIAFIRMVTERLIFINDFRDVYIQSHIHACITGTILSARP